MLWAVISDIGLLLYHVVQSVSNLKSFILKILKLYEPVKVEEKDLLYDCYFSGLFNHF